MVCPECSYENPATSVQCEKCTTPLPLSGQTLATGGQGWSVPAAEGIISTTALVQLSPGTSIGSRYEIVRLLGQGGMGAVYQAHDKELERQVAIKVIRADMAANPEILRRFKQELILARQITHKNVIRIFDLGQADGIKFITMEYIEGENLQAVLRQKKKLAPAEAASILAQVCRALEAAHNEGVIHRDLKPQNIMLDKTGRAYVMDFGIARSMLGSGMTQTGALIGTPDYMSPEQAKGQTLDARSDLFSIGIIFYEMLSGQVPFDADTTMGKLWKRTNEPARPLDELDKSIPKPLSDIVRKCSGDRSAKAVCQRGRIVTSDRIVARAWCRNARRYSFGRCIAGLRKMGGRWTGSHCDCRHFILPFENNSAPQCSSRAGDATDRRFRQQDRGLSF